MGLKLLFKKIRRGVTVAVLGVSTKLLHVQPAVSTEMGDRFVGIPPHV